MNREMHLIEINFDQIEVSEMHEFEIMPVNMLR